jgi:SAM-dependent methyltransferase
MLEKAKSKLNGINNATIHNALVTDLPLKDCSFDVVISTQVIHHLDDEKTCTTRERGIQMFREVQRVLKQNGIFIINTTFPYQYELGYWYSDFIPKAIQIFNKKLPSQDQLEKMIDTSDMTLISMEYLEDPLMGSDYLNPRGPLFKKWRDGDSGFAVLDDDEIDEMMQEIKKKIEDGTIDKFIEKKELQRKKVGQSTFIICKK